MSSNLFDTILTGRERYAESVMEHTMLGIDRILNGSSNGPQQPMPGNPTLVERPSPCADLGTVEVSVPHERFVARVRELLSAERFDDALSFVEDEYRSINGREPK